MGGLALIQALQMHPYYIYPTQFLVKIFWTLDDLKYLLMKKCEEGKKNFTFTFTGHLLTLFNNLPNLHSSSLTNIYILRCNWVWSMCTLTHVSVCFPVLIILNYSLKKDIKWWSSSSSTQPATQRRVEPAILTFCLPDTPGRWFCPHTWPASWLVYSINAWDEHCPIYLTKDA